MSVRARSARRLASLLTRASGVHVEVRYERELRVYRVVWTGGPETAGMSQCVAAHAKSVPELDVTELRWCRRLDNHGHDDQSMGRAS
ncbi:hypothetical protein [Kibdelosporangium philippinense]|uniref:hypothetical protein n=1 Tax=Kibdelosporangium philippinense TaxID=211113 RepID=UPI0036130D5F